MYYRVRTAVPDTPGALAVLAQRCGRAGVNILGLQIYPGLGSVTDDLVLSVPESWPPSRVVELVESAGGSDVSVVACTAHELQDQPTRWLAAVRSLIEDPTRLQAELTALVGPRTGLAPAESARAAALTEIAEALGDVPGPERVHRSVVEYDESDVGVDARVGAGLVGSGHFISQPGGSVQAAIEVAPAWRRMGVGRQLLRRLCQIAARSGADELVLIASPDEGGLVPLLAAAGLRGRIRLTEAGLQVRVSLNGVLPGSASSPRAD